MYGLEVPYPWAARSSSAALPPLNQLRRLDTVRHRARRYPPPHRHPVRQSRQRSPVRITQNTALLKQRQFGFQNGPSPVLGVVAVIGRISDNGSGCTHWAGLPGG